MKHYLQVLAKPPRSRSLTSVQASSGIPVVLYQDRCDDVTMVVPDLSHLVDHPLLSQLLGDAGHRQRPWLGNPGEAKPLEVVAARVLGAKRVAVGETVLRVGEAGRRRKVGSDGGTASGDRGRLL